MDAQHRARPGWVGLGELARPSRCANASVYAADIGVALAEADLAEAARAKIADNLATWPEDFWVRVHAGDTLVELDDFNAAEAHVAATVEMADDTDFEALSDANDRLADPSPAPPESAQQRPPLRSHGQDVSWGPVPVR